MGCAESHTFSRREFFVGAGVAAATGLGITRGSAVTTSGSQLLVGAAKRIITPDPLLPVSGGMGPTHPTREKRGDLTARVMYLRRDDVGVAVVSLDLLGFPSVLADPVRARVTRLAADTNLIRSTHTHSA